MNAVAQSVDYSWKPQPGPQTAFMQLPADVTEVMYGGARGGGKTFAAVGFLLSMALRYGEKYKAIFFRRELTQLRGVIEETKKIYPKHGAIFKEGKKEWHFPNGAIIYFAHLERDSDAEKYQGWSVQTIVFEEAGNFPNEAVVNKMRGILRSVDGVPTRLIMTANPGGPGHTWLKARFIDPAPFGYKYLTDTVKLTDPDTGEEYTEKVKRVFIPAKVKDNALLIKNNPMYTAQLAQTGSPELVKAWLDGDWNSIPGAFFNFSVERHVLRSCDLPSWWLRFRSMDWGSAAPFAVYWWAVASEDWQSPCGKIVPKGAMIAYREWYGIQHKTNDDGTEGDFMPNKGLRMYAEDIGRGIVARELGDHKITYGVIDPSAFAQDGGPSIAERVSQGAREAILDIKRKTRREPKNKVFWRKADNKRVQGRGAAGGWDALRARLDGFEYAPDHNTPMIFFFDSCIHAIRTIPDMQHDEDNPEDIDTTAEDHAADAVRYGVMSRPWKRPTPASTVPIDQQSLPGATFDEILAALNTERRPDERVH